MMASARNNLDYGRAAILEADGRHVDALPLYRAAADWYHGRASVYPEARALVGAGRCELALGQTAEALVDLRAAAETFERLGATVLRHEVDVVLAASSRETQRRSG